MFSFRSRGGPAATPPPVDDLSQAPLALLPAKSTSFLGENLEIDAQLRNSILVAGAGDARANGLYRRCGTQNDAPRAAASGARARRRRCERLWIPRAQNPPPRARSPGPPTGAARRAARNRPTPPQALATRRPELALHPPRRVERVGPR